VEGTPGLQPSSAPFDCSNYLTVVLCGDQRLGLLFRQDELVPLAGRIRTRLVMDYAAREQLRELLIHAMTQAGNRKLMTDELMDTLVEHAAGNFRTLMTMAGELLMAGVAREAAQLDEKLYFEVYPPPSNRREAKAAVPAGRRR